MMHGDDNSSVYSNQKTVVASHGSYTRPTAPANHAPVPAAPVISAEQPQQQQQQAGQAHNSGEKKKPRLTVPKSPKFSTMSWQRRQQEFTEAIQRDQAPQPQAQKKRSISVGKTRTTYL